VNAVSGNEKDDFWDVEKLVPKNKQPPFHSTAGGHYSSSAFANRKMVEDVDISGEADTAGDNRRLTSRASFFNYEEIQYAPVGSGLIKNVKIREYLDKYDFYDSFRKSAVLYFDCTAQRCDYASFYSYLPQYSQLNREQKSYYFYWRDELRHGRYIKTDYSYLYLFVFEILNLPDKIPPEKGLDLLCDIWEEYRSALPRIDANFVTWVQDYCLVHKLPCPRKRLNGFIYDIINTAAFKEFYLPDASELCNETAGALVAYLSDYDWRRGKYASGEFKERYEKLMLGAMRRILAFVFDGERAVASTETEKLSRAAFPNSLCTHSVKRDLEIEYYPICRHYPLRRTVTEAVRYTENKLRALCGVKSRLAVKSLSDEYKRIIDLYFEIFTEKEKQRVRTASKPEYEKLYDAPSAAYSLEDADEIENASWSVTARLVENSEDTAELEASATEVLSIALPEETSVEDVATATEDDPENSRYGLSDEDISLIEAALSAPHKNGLGTDNSVERINEAFSDNTGDIIFEYDGESYNLIDDYREDIEEWLKKIKK
jgi:hypothetical protein